MNCKDCAYWYQGVDDDFPQCHCPYDDVAPCEYDENFLEDLEEYEEIYWQTSNMWYNKYNERKENEKWQIFIW